MKKKTANRIVLWTVLAFLAGLYFFIKFAIHPFIESLYQKGRFATLNKIAQVKGEESLDFYVGWLDDTVIGPIIQMIAGLFLLGYGLVYLKDAEAKIFGIAIFVYLLVTK